jgi:DNA-binding MarR family transcriptional regulator
MSTILTIMADDPVEHLVWETRRLVRELAALADESLAALHITASERALIEFLARESGPVTLAELARKRSVSRQHIHQSLNRLKNPKWIEKRPDPSDARSVLLRLTDEGRALWKRVRTVDRAILRQIARHVDRDDARAAAQTLRQIRQSLHGGIHD